MNHVRWAVQTNLGSADDIEKLCLSLERLNIELVKLRVIPFDDTPPDVPSDGRTIFYGSTTLMKNVARDGRWRPGVFFDEARFSFEALRAGYGELLLNGASEVLPVGALLARDCAPETEFFLRPAGDLKEFAGRVYTFAELAPWRDGLASSNGPMDLDTLVQVAEPRALGREWRTVVVDGAVIAASQYRSSGRLKVTGDVPDAVLRFAAEMVARYQPAPVFVLDVGEVDEGLRVIETNCFNSAGFYWCDLYEIARRVTAFVRAM